jgi:hypothetical protein
MKESARVLDIDFDQAGRGTITMSVHTMSVAGDDDGEEAAS